VTKARACKVAGQKGSPRLTPHASGSVGKCERMNLTLPRELPLWGLEFRWIPEFSKNDYKGQNSIN